MSSRRHYVRQVVPPPGGCVVLTAHNAANSYHPPTADHPADAPTEPPPYPACRSSEPSSSPVGVVVFVALGVVVVVALGVGPSSPSESDPSPPLDSRLGVLVVPGVVGRVVRGFVVGLFGVVIVGLVRRVVGVVLGVLLGLAGGSSLGSSPDSSSSDSSFESASSSSSDLSDDSSESALSALESPSDSPEAPSLDSVSSESSSDSPRRRALGVFVGRVVLGPLAGLALWLVPGVLAGPLGLVTPHGARHALVGLLAPPVLAGALDVALEALGALLHLLEVALDLGGLGLVVLLFLALGHRPGLTRAGRTQSSRSASSSALPRSASFSRR